MDILLRNCRVVSPAQKLDEVADLLIVAGTFEKIGTDLTAPEGCVIRDMLGAVAAPGFIDMHVHLREPGFEHKETIESGCHAAAAGGFTAVCCMPNTNPAIDDAGIAASIVEKSRNVLQGVVDVHPVAAATKGREGKELSPMMELAGAGAVAFTDDGAPIQSAEVMRRALEYASMIGKPIIQHAEDTAMTHGGAMNEGFVSTALGMQAMPPVAEDIIVARDIRLAEYLDAQYHVAHISTAGAAELVRSAKAKKLRVTCEVTPHHFTLTDEAVRSFDTNTKMNPPLRSRSDVEAMKAALADGTIDVIATDHAPHSYDEKQVEYIYAPFGIVGLETALGLAMTELVEKKIISLHQLIEKCSINPRKILHLAAIEIAEGKRANLTLFDPTREWVVDTQRFKSKSKNSPFHGMKLRGKAVGIINNSSSYFSES